MNTRNIKRIVENIVENNYQIYDEFFKFEYKESKEQLDSSIVPTIDEYSSTAGSSLYWDRYFVVYKDGSTTEVPADTKIESGIKIVEPEYRNGDKIKEYLNKNTVAIINFYRDWDSDEAIVTVFRKWK